MHLPPSSTPFSLWLVDGCPPVDVSPTMEKSEFLHCQEYHIFMTWENPGHGPNQILWDTRTELFKTHKTVTNGIH